MNRFVRDAAVIAAVIVGLGWLASCNRAPSADSGGAAGVAWHSDLASAMSRAGQENKLVMVDFYTDWCGWCKKLEQTTFADAGVQSQLAKLVAVRLNAEKGGEKEAAQFGVQGYPTIVFLNASGKEVGRIPGYLPPGPFLEELKDILSRA